MEKIAQEMWRTRDSSPSREGTSCFQHSSESQHFSIIFSKRRFAKNFLALLHLRVKLTLRNCSKVKKVYESTDIHVLRLKTTNLVSKMNFYLGSDKLRLFIWCD